jgi:shikimate kinase
MGIFNISANVANDLSALVLVGLPGAGKSSVGQILAERMDWTFLDLDQAIEAETGLSVAEIFQRMGEPYFRGLESDLTKRLASQHQVVFAPGGGWMTNPALPALLPPHSVMVWLKVRPQIALERLRASGVTRPLLHVDDALTRMQQLLNERSALYERADISFDTDEYDPRSVAEMIYLWLIKQTKYGLSS